MIKLFTPLFVALFSYFASMGMMVYNVHYINEPNNCFAWLIAAVVAALAVPREWDLAREKFLAMGDDD